MLPKDFYYKVEEPGYLRTILYGDTDSLYVLVPARALDLGDKQRILNEAARRINEEIRRYFIEWLLPRQNVNPEHCHVDFKTEYLIESILFLDTKKNYSFKALAREGKPYPEPVVKTVGGQTVKSDTAALSRELLNALIRNILDEASPETIKEVYESFHRRFLECCRALEIEPIGIPGKWGRKKQIIDGMQLYNRLVEPVFQPGSAGLYVYCRFDDPVRFHDFKGICFPYVFDREKVSRTLNEKGVNIDVATQWDKILTLTGERLLAVIREQYGRSLL